MANYNENVVIENKKFFSCKKLKRGYIRLIIENNQLTLLKHREIQGRIMYSVETKLNNFIGVSLNNMRDYQNKCITIHIWDDDHDNVIMFLKSLKETDRLGFTYYRKAYGNNGSEENKLVLQGFNMEHIILESHNEKTGEVKHRMGIKSLYSIEHNWNNYIVRIDDLDN